MSDEDFQVVYDALKAVTTPYTDDEIPGIIIGERKAWAVVKRVHRETAMQMCGVCGERPIDTAGRCISCLDNVMHDESAVDYEEDD